MSFIKAGNHLAVVRSFIQSFAVNGEKVTWGSQDLLDFRSKLSVCDFEMLAQRVCNAVQPRFKDETERDMVIRWLRNKAMSGVTYNDIDITAAIRNLAMHLNRSTQ